MLLHSPLWGLHSPGPLLNKVKLLGGLSCLSCFLPLPLCISQDSSGLTSSKFTLAVATREFIVRMMGIELQIQRNTENLWNPEGPQDPDPAYTTLFCLFNRLHPLQPQTGLLHLHWEGHGSCPSQEYIGLRYKRRVQYSRKTSLRVWAICVKSLSPSQLQRPVGWR